MKIDISGLSEGLHQYTLTPEPSEIGLGEQFRETVRVFLTLDKSNRQIHTKVRVETVGSFCCDRCIDEFTRQVRNAYQMFYTSEEVDQGLCEVDEVQFVSPDVREIDIGDDVRQIVMLAIPQKLLCKESCAGLCPRCGWNLNRGRCSCRVEEVDPRWDKLRGLLDYQ